ncbi:MAG: hypothetical protein KAT04_01930 [Methylococcales bacterium]|nr:hypothetical protein [Methylococcales bacterium]
MAKAASPIRLQADLMQAAELTAKRFHRSTAEQVEYWADLGRTVSSTLDPDILLSIASGLTAIKTEPVICVPIDPNKVFNALEEDRKKGRLADTVTSSAVKYQASKTHPGYLEKIQQNGAITIGQFNNGEFTALNEMDS